MDSKKLKKRKKLADKPERLKYIDELNRPIVYILDDVKETIVTENTYKPIPMSVLMQYFLPKGGSKTKKANLPLMVGWLFV